MRCRRHWTSGLGRKCGGLPTRSNGQDSAAGTAPRGAARRLTEESLRQAECLQHRAAELVAALRQQCLQPPLPTQADVFRELLALYREFDEVELDCKTGQVAVTIGPIELEEIDLGRFEIRLDWKESSGPAPYRVIALDPNSPAGREDVTHPHVQDETLCEGEGRAAVRAALAEGRLFDFFLIVSRLLETYSRGNAYVEMNRWQGIPCADCGTSVHEDERYSCGRCDETLCGECSTTCPGCEHEHCSQCLSTCEVCGGQHCPSCIDACAACGRATCRDCLEDDLCEECHEKREQELEGDDPPDDGANPSADDAQARKEGLVPAA